MNTSEIVIEKVLTIESCRDSLKVVVKCTDQKIYDLNFEIEDIALASFTFDSNQGFINIPVGKMYAQINKEYLEKHVTSNMAKYVFQHQNDDFYIVMSFDTFDRVKEALSSLLQIASGGVLYRGHKILIDNSLKLGEVVFR